MTDLSAFSAAVEALPEPHRRVLQTSLQHFEYVARVGYADGSREAQAAEELLDATGGAADKTFDYLYCLGARLWRAGRLATGEIDRFPAAAQLAKAYGRQADPLAL